MPFSFCLERCSINGISGLAILIGKSTLFRFVALKSADGTEIDVVAGYW
jgi:hypothetical protein